MDIAALTIVSKNYISFARVLCESFLKEHPGAEFFVVLVDKFDEEFDLKNEKFTLLFLNDIRLPAVDIFPYQYTILELNTAVKPFALKFLLENRDIEKIAYIDPDIFIAKELEKVWSGLDDHSVVLTPHMRKPFNDDLSPNEIDILQSGTYNLGFIGLKNNESCLKLLNWWISKLYLDCVVDIPNGLFVDQKWMDLVPAYIEDTYILHDPTYNAAYWNIHERDITENNGRYYVDGKLLSFFHFSGYTPIKKDILSKHQNRHSFNENPDLEKLFELYGSKLIDSGFINTSKYYYAFSELSNAIKVSKGMHVIIRHCLKNNISCPSPEFEADAFCEFMMTPNSALYGYRVAPMIHGILQTRKDVKEHYPNAWFAHDDGFMAWLNNSGKNEENLSKLLDKFGWCLEVTNPIEQIFTVYNERKDLQSTFEGIAVKSEDFDGFCSWIKNHGVDEEGFKKYYSERFYTARNGLFKSIITYYLRPDLQAAFPTMHNDPVHYFNWLMNNLHNMPHLTEDEIYMFYGLSMLSGQLIGAMQLKYNSVLRDKVGESLTCFNIDKYYDYGNKYFGLSDKKFILSVAINNDYIGPIEQLEVLYSSSAKLQEKYPNAFNSMEIMQQLGKSVIGIAGHKMFFMDKKWVKQLKNEVKAYRPRGVGINISGYFDASTGMGQSSRSMLATIKEAGIAYSIKTLPNTHIDPSGSYLDESISSYFGFGRAENRINLIVSNADAIDNSIKFYSTSEMLDRRNIGYWVWETEELPQKFKKASQSLDEVWTPSEYSAAAIRKCIDLPVHVLPHIIDFNEIDMIRNNGITRVAFGLPESALIFGYFFDQKSVFERKNPKGVIKAFREAFGEGVNDNIVLLLKVNTPKGGELEYEMLKAENNDLNIIWFEETLSREKTLSLMNCLDVYVSLHRSEGFGLTMAEAMALGKPVIASNYSGNIDFMDNESSILINTPAIITTRNYGPYPKGTIWGDPDIIDASYAMVRLIDESERVSIGKLAIGKARAKLSVSVVSEKFSDLVKFDK